MSVIASRFTEISVRARPYPSYLLEETDECLAVFAAGFLGWNDAVHFARAGLTAVCVDCDKDKLFEMSTIYPPGWAFRVADAWEFAEEAAWMGRQWDVVTVDPYFENCAQRVWETLPLWLSLTRRIATITVHADTELDLPEGWKSSYFSRGHNVGWAVISRA